MTVAATTLLEVRHLTKNYTVRRDARATFRARRGTGNFVRALDDVSITMTPGQALGVVGESGSGKSTLGRLVTGLERPTSGSVHVDGDPDARTSPVQMVFQDPVSSLDPRMRVWRSVAEPLTGASRSERRARARQALAMVALPAEIDQRYPHELSGGQAQRVCLARALIGSPRLVVLDEAVASLDVSTQSEILALLRRIRRESRLSYIFISHDLRAVRTVSDTVAVMYFGQIVEIAPTENVQFLHPYSVALHSSETTLTRRSGTRIVLHGEIPSATSHPTGCRFADRCPVAQEKCEKEPPGLDRAKPEQWVACHYPGSLSP